MRSRALTQLLSKRTGECIKLYSGPTDAVPQQLDADVEVIHQGLDFANSGRKNHRLEPPAAMTPNGLDHVDFAEKLGRGAIADNYVRSFLTVDMPCATRSAEGANNAAARLSRIIRLEGMVYAVLLEDNHHGPLTRSESDNRATILSALREQSVPSISVVPQIGMTAIESRTADMNPELTGQASVPVALPSAVSGA